ncbi:MAG: hypothetical protein Q8P97_01240 [bacterium]|nr:hypothetical protein [bacterium]
MKKLLITVLIASLAMVCQLAQAAEWKPDLNAPMASNIPTDVANLAGGVSIDVKSVGDRFEITLYEVKLTPKGGGALYDAEVIRIASGILDAAKASGNQKVMSEYVTEAKPENGKVVFSIANYAKVSGVPIVEHLWGIGKVKDDSSVKFLVLNPDSPWVSYETSWGSPNLETLHISILMCPNGKAVPVKSLGKGKIKQGKHPELADACK